MEGWIVVVLIAVGLFAGLIIYDKRNFIASKFKNLSTRPKKEKTPKEHVKKEKIKKEKVKKEKKPKEETKQETQVDYDTIVLEDNITFGKEQETESVQDDNIPDIFTQKNDLDDDDDIDLDELFEQLRQNESKNYERNTFDNEFDFSNFENMSTDEIDDFLENSFSYDDLSDGVKSSVDSFGYNNNLKGKDLGEMIKNLPPEIKALIIGDILKPKF